MRRFRFSIANLLILVLFLGIAMAALREATDPWDSGVFGVTLVLLVASILLAVHRAGEARACWLGFAVFGWIYLVLALIPPIESRLPTSKALSYLDSKVADRPVSMTFITTSTGPNGPPFDVVSFTPNGNTPTINPLPTVSWNAATTRVITGPNGTTENFVRIGHSLAALILAFLGAHFSRRLNRSRRVEASPIATGR